MDDWSHYFLKAEQHLKKSSDLLLLGEKEQGIAELVKSKAFMDMVFAALCLNK